MLSNTAEKENHRWGCMYCIEKFVHNDRSNAIFPLLVTENSAYCKYYLLVWDALLVVSVTVASVCELWLQLVDESCATEAGNGDSSGSAVPQDDFFRFFRCSVQHLHIFSLWWDTTGTLKCWTSRDHWHVVSLHNKRVMHCPINSADINVGFLSFQAEL